MSERSSVPAARTVVKMAGRPRSEASRRAVLDAAFAILVETGLGCFSIDAVATRAGVAQRSIDGGQRRVYLPTKASSKRSDPSFRLRAADLQPKIFVPSFCRLLGPLAGQPDALLPR
jgi:hypothetical protein